MDTLDEGTIYVSTCGNDGWSGLWPDPASDGADGPVATLAHAVALTRARGSAGPRRIVVREGAYYNVAVSLDERDSGLTIEAAPGERPVLYGGQPVVNWQQDGEFWSAVLPQVGGKPWDFRMLQVNGRMCPRARYPQEGELFHESEFPVRWMTSTGGGWEREPTGAELTTLKYKEGDLGPWLEVANAEVTAYHAWDDSMVGVAAINPEQRLLTFSSPCGHPPGGFGSWLERARSYVVWNIREGMTQPGQWYLDRAAGKVFYWPLEGEVLNEIEALAPTTERIVDIQARDDAVVEKLTLRGLTLLLTNTPLVAAGFGAANLDGAITGVDPLVECIFEDLKIINVAGHGIKITDRVKGRGTGLDPEMDKSRPSPNQRTRIAGCETFATGAGGIKLIAQDSVITDNYVHAVGVLYPAAIGIWFTGDRIEVSHNDISDTSYSGIAGHFGKAARVEYNDMARVMQVLADGAAIYVFYVTELSMRGNVTRDISEEGGKPRHAYYLDELSEDCVVAENLAVGVGWPSHDHMARNNRIEQNVFVHSGDMVWTFPRSSNCVVVRNVCYAGGAIRIYDAGAVSEFTDNIFYSVTGERVVLPSGYREGVLDAELLPDDNGTLQADPLFVDMQGGDFSFQAASPAHRLGIEPIDISQAGRRNR
jgi:hypothetical protein